MVLGTPSCALDMSIQPLLLNGPADLAERLGLTYFFMPHDLAVIGHFYD